MPDQSLGRGLESLIPKKDFPKREPEVNLSRPVTDGNGNQPVQPAPFEPAVDLRPRTQYSEPKREEAIFYIETERIKPNPEQPRREFDEARLTELADSIREHGILQPLVVSKIETEVPTGTKVEYQLIAGERRLLASKKAGLTQIPVIIRRTPTEQEKLELALIENIQREDLNIIEKARAFEKLINDFQLLQKDIAQRVGKSRESVANALRLLNLPLEIQKGLEEQKINEGHARAILTLANPEKQRALYYSIVQNSLSVREAQDLAANFGSRRKYGNRRVSDPEIKDLESRLEETLGTKVSVRKIGDQGKIQIAFYSEDELAEIVNRILTASQDQPNYPPQDYVPENYAPENAAPPEETQPENYAPANPAEEPNREPDRTEYFEII